MKFISIISKKLNFSFENTKIAFKHKSNFELVKSYLIFKSFDFLILVKYGIKIINFALTIKLPIKWIIKKSIFSQFCGGENISECDITSQKLINSNIYTILDYSVEGEGNEIDFNRNFNELKAVILNSKENSKCPIAVFKCSGIGDFSMLEKRSFNIRNSINNVDSTEYINFKNRFYFLCKIANESGIKLYIDAEESWIQPAIDEITYEHMLFFNKKKCVLYNTIQLYRTNRLEEIQFQINNAKRNSYYIGFKLVRGAYLEKERKRANYLNIESPIQPSKDATDFEFDNAVKLCFDNRNFVNICLGTHNEKSTEYLINLLEINKISKNDDRFWFAQLFGMSDHISYNLAFAGFNVAKYLPYGPIKDVLPYLYRRAQENSSVKGQSSREISLIKCELKRRKSRKN